MAVIIGERIKEARESLGLSVTNLAELLDVERSAIYQYENSESQPSPDKFSRLCNILFQDSNFFYKPIFNINYSLKNTHFRSLKSIKVIQRSQASTKFKWVMEYHSILESYVSMPKLNIPKTETFHTPLAITNNYIENLANETREYWGLGKTPILNLVKTLESNGFVIVRFPLDIDGLDGMSYWSFEYKRPFILLNSDKNNYVRSRFDLAHELAHMILHRDIKPSESEGSYDLMEKQAHFFAACLIMPRSSWVRDINNQFTLATFRSLKPKWKVSIIAQIMQAFSLDVIDKSKKESLIKQLSNRGWRRREPFDDQWTPEQPALIQQATEMVAQKGSGIQSITRKFPHRLDDLSNITNLPRAFFEIDTLAMSLKSTDISYKN